MGARIAVLGIALSLFGCAGTMQCPAKGGAAWREIESPHLRVRTNLDIADARRAAQHLERVHGAIADAVLHAAPSDGDKLELVLLPSGTSFFEHAVVHEPELRDVWTSHFAVPPSPAGGPQALVLDVLDVRTLRTENRLPFSSGLWANQWLARSVLARHLPGAPAWLLTGMALYLSTIQITDDAATIGQPLQVTRGRDADRGHLSLRDRSLPRAREIMRASTLDLDEKLRNNFEYEISAWLLVHLLMHEPRYRERLDKYLGLIAGGSDEAEAWRQGFGDVPIEKLEEEHQHHGVVTSLFRVPFRAADATLKERVMADEEVHLLWSRISRFDQPRAAAELAEAERVAPRAPQVVLARAQDHARGGRCREARAAATEAARAPGAEARAWLVLGEVLLAGDAACTEGAAPGIGEVARHVGRKGGTTQMLEFAARGFERAQEPQLAATFARRAVDKDPSCWRCWETLARVSPNREDAALAIARAAALLSNDATPEEIERLRKTRETVKAAR